MPRDSLFSRSNAENGDENSTEGVRLLGAEEAEKAAERSEVVRRSERDLPRYGDRPAPPPDDVKPALRFPLPDVDDASSIERPRVAPVVPRRAPGHVEPMGDLGGTGGSDDADDPFEPGPGHDDDGGGVSRDQPMISFEPATGETELPHWTEPATGEVPRVIIGEHDDDDESSRWMDFATSGGPRWRDEHDSWDDTGVVDIVGDDLEGHEEPAGALDTSERPTQEEFFGFDDLDVPEAELPKARTRATRSAVRGERPGAQPVRQRQTRVARVERGSEAPAAPRAVPSEAEGEPGGRDVPMAVFVGIAIAAVALILFKVGPGATMIIIEVALIVAAVELFGAFRQGGYQPATLLGLAAVAAFPLACWWRGDTAIPLVLFLTVVFSMLWYLLGVSGQVQVLPNLGATFLGVAYIGVLGSFAALIVKIPVEGVSILLLAVVAAVGYDVGGFFIGRRLGRRPLSQVSPNKTVEGLVGGMATTVLGLIIFGAILGFGPFSFGQVLVLGIATAVAAPFGDLCESLLKRDLGIKDMSAILPEHGGVLDRFDGLLFVLPTVYYVARAFSLA